MTTYIEVNSAYRNRVDYPLASDFVVFPSESGCKTAATATDPYSLASPIIQPFVPFVSVCGTVTSGNVAPPYIGNSSEGTALIISFAAGSAITIKDYYSGAVLFDGAVPVARISFWDFVGTLGGLDYFQVITDVTIPAGTAVCVFDPTDLAILPSPIIFLPVSIGSSNTDNYYIGTIVYNQTRNEWLPILDYDGTSHSAILDTSNPVNYTPGTWLLTDTYLVRGQVPMQYGQTLTVNTSTTATIVPPSPGAPPGSYIGNFIRILNAPSPQAEMYRIVGYNAGIATVNPAFVQVPGSVLNYEMLQFSSDNEGYLVFNNSYAAIRESVCYDVSLVSLILPSNTLIVGSGSKSIFYPYFYVEFRSLKGGESQTSNSLITNNPNGKRALFRSTITDYPDALLNPFIRLGGDGMTQRIKLDPLGSYRFRVFLPSGELFQTIIPESYSPYPPNKLAQITALFSLTRVNAF